MQLYASGACRESTWNAARITAAALALLFTVCLSPTENRLAAQDPADSSAADPPAENPFPGRFPAPSLEGGTEWFNTTGEIDIRELRGKVVLLDFWTYCCINCMHVLPDLKYLEQKYANELVVIGVHAAKFDNEKDSENIRRAILRYEIEHPVVNDANGVIAEKYLFRAWPQLVLVDPEGEFVGLQTGEGIRDLFDTVIGKVVEYHRAKGTLDETPVRFDLERDRVQPGPLRFPGKVLADEAGDRLFISDSNHNRIVISSLDGKLLDVIGTGAVGMVDGDYNKATFNHPQGMALVGSTLFVADTENHLLRTVDLESRSVATLAGTGEQSQVRTDGGPLRETALNSPWDLLALDGTLYVCMAGPHQLWQQRLGSDTIEVFAGNGREDILDGPLAYSSLAQPSGITTDGRALYFVDSEGSAVRKATLGARGEVTTIVGAHDLERGRSLFEFGDIDGAGDIVRLQHPLGIAYRDGKLYVADAYNHKIKAIDPATRESRSLLGTGEAGVSTSPLQLSEPAGLTFAGDTLYIADTNNHRLLAVDVEGDMVREFVVQGLMPPNPVTEPRPATTGPEATVVAAQRVQPGESLRFRIAFELPEGFKLNKLGPVTYTLNATGEQSLIAPDQLNVRGEADKGELEATIEVPLANQGGAGAFELALSYTYCREGTGGVCRFARQAWSVPIEVSSDAEATEVPLIATP